MKEKQFLPLANSQVIFFGKGHLKTHIDFNEPYNATFRQS